MTIHAVIFDLDGVIVSTDEYHYQAWQQIADEEGISFDRRINERLRGVSRMESLEIILRQAPRSYSETEKLGLAHRKNEYYRQLLNRLTPGDILPGVMAMLAAIKRRQVKTAIGSSSRNTPTILEKIGLADAFDAIADGNQIARSKPDPEVFLLAADKLGISPENCAVVEDAEAGIEAALRAGMRAVGVGSAAHCPQAHIRASAIADLDVDELLA